MLILSEPLIGYTSRSLHLLLSIMKENSFLCRDARIQTRDLEYRNQTWSVSFSFNPSRDDADGQGVLVRGVGRPVHPIRQKLEGMGQDGIQPAARASATRCPRTHFQDQVGEYEESARPS